MITMPTVRYRKNIEPDIVAQIDAVLATWLWLVPGWVQLVAVVFKDGGKKHSARVEVNYDYRKVKLVIYSAWLNQPIALKHEDMVHELIHIPLALINDFCRDKIDLLCPHDTNETFNLSLNADLRERNEAATQDLAKAIFDQFRTTCVSGRPKSK